MMGQDVWDEIILVFLDISIFWASHASNNTNIHELATSISIQEILLSDHPSDFFLE